MLKERRLKKATAPPAEGEGQFSMKSVASEGDWGTTFSVMWDGVTLRYPDLLPSRRGFCLVEVGR